MHEREKERESASERASEREREREREREKMCLNTASLSKVRGETGEEGREGSKRVSGQDPILLFNAVVRKECDISNQFFVSRVTERLER